MSSQYAVAGAGAVGAVADMVAVLYMYHWKVCELLLRAEPLAG